MKRKEKKRKEKEKKKKKKKKGDREGEPNEKCVKKGRPKIVHGSDVTGIVIATVPKLSTTQ